jgi:hypothetical protein
MRKFFSVLWQTLGVLFVALFVRFRQGASMFDPFFFIPLACFSAVLVGPVLIRLRRDSREPVTLQVGRAVACASAWMLAILTASVLAVNLLPWTGGWLFPEWTTALYAVLLSVAVATASASVMALLLARLSAEGARWLFRGLMLATLLAYRAVPAEWTGHTIEAVLDRGLATVVLTATAALAVMDAGLLRLLALAPIGRDKTQPGEDL